MTVDFEKLGAFFLGKRFDAQSNSVVDDELLLYDAKDLTTHAVCVGMTGSGKTGLCLTLLEEAAIDGVPAICIDPKGDLANLCLSFPNLEASEFEPWIDPGEAERKGRSVAEHARATAELWREGLAKWGQDGARIARFKDAVDVRVYTPGSSAGYSVSALRSFQAPAQSIVEDGDAFGDKVNGAVSGLLALIGIEADSFQSPEHILLSKILTDSWQRGESIDLSELIRAVVEPPFSRLGVMDVDTVFPPQNRQKLAIQLNSLVASPGFANWSAGDPLDVGSFLWTPEGKPRIAIMSIAHLDDKERMFFVTLLLNEVVSWMRSQSGTSSLRALLYMDEVFGFLPPVANPPSKTPMLTLLKQARAFGLGVVLATQNPVDIDYKALSNCGTWFLGRLQTERDVARVLDGLAGASEAAGHRFDRSAMEALLAGLKSRVFLMNNAHDDEPFLFHTRWALSYLRGPLTREQLKRLKPLLDKVKTPASPIQSVAASAPATNGGRATKDSATQRPIIGDSVEELFLDNTSGEYEPFLLAQANLHYVRASTNLDTWEKPLLMAPFNSAEVSEVWSAAEPLDEDELETFDAAPSEAVFQTLPRGGLDEKRVKSLQRALKAHLYQEQSKPVWQCKKLKLVSKPEDTKADFAARVQLATREVRDLEIEKMRAKFGTKLKRLQDRIRRAEEKVEREQSQYDQQKLQTGISVGATVLGAIFGRRAIGRATTAARGAGRVGRERQDVARAKDALEDLQQQLQDLEREFEDHKQDRLDELSEPPEITEILVRPRKGDMEISRFALAWRRA